MFQQRSKPIETSLECFDDVTKTPTQIPLFPVVGTEMPVDAEILTIEVTNVTFGEPLFGRGGGGGLVSVFYGSGIIENWNTVE